MKELLDLKKFWDWLSDKWRNAFGCFVLVVISFLIGMTAQSKFITEDCKFMGAFRDGTQAYSCQVRTR